MGMKAIAVAAGVACALAACNNTPKWQTTTRGGTPGTVVDVHGNTDVAFLVGGSCGANAAGFPLSPNDWWNAFTPSVRLVGAAVGYLAFFNGTKPNPCPKVIRTDVYRAVYTVDLSPFAGQSGSIVSAAARLTVLATGGDNGALAPLTGPFPTNAFACDPVTGGASQLFQVAGALPTPSGLQVNAINSGQFDINHPPIPDSYPTGPLVFTFPPKNASAPGNLGQPQFTADVTQIVIGALQANVTTIKFMITGTNEPVKMTNGPDTPQRDVPALVMADCRAVIRLDVDVQTP
jgi:hypothetical protein